MELKKLVKNTSFLVFSKSVQFILGIIRSKLAAIFIGTTGVGITTQVSFLTTMISNLALFSMNDGLVNQVARNKENTDFTATLKELMKSYAVLISFTIILALTVCLLFAKKLTVFFLGDEEYIIYYLVGVTCIPIVILNSFSFAILKSYKATKLISNSNILSSVIGLIVYIPLIYFYKIPGAVISVAINFMVVLVINNYQARTKILKNIGVKFKELFYAKAKKTHFKELLYFAFFGATTGLVLLISESICRSAVVNILGISKMGIYSPITSWSGLFTGFIIPSLSVYLFPRFSECKSNAEISGILNDTLRLVSFIMIPVLFLAIPFRNIIIPIFYSKEFLEAGIYLPWHFLGLLFYMWWYPMTQVLTPTGKIKIHGIFIIAMSAINVAVVYIFVPIFGLYGWMLKFIFSPVLFSCVYFIYIKRIYRFNLARKNILLMLFVLLVTLILVALDKFQIKYLITLLSLGFSVIFLTKLERKYIINKIKSFRN